MSLDTTTQWGLPRSEVQAGVMAADGTDDAPDGNALVAAVTRALDPVLAPFGFAAGQGGADDPPRPWDPADPAPRVDGQIIFCRGFRDGSPGCEDLVVDLVADPRWRVRTVRDTEHAHGPWSNDYDDGPLETVLARIVDDVTHRFGDR
jgi:hypothetical protein